MAQQYASDEVVLAFPAAPGSNGRYSTNFINAGPNWSFTLHGIPTLADIRVEANNSKYFKEGAAGNVNPISFAIKASNESPHATGTAVDTNFSSNWVTIKPQTEFYLASNSGCVSCDTGVFQVQGQFRFIRLSMSAAPMAAGSRAYYFDSSSILRG